MWEMDLTAGMKVASGSSESCSNQLLRCVQESWSENGSSTEKPFSSTRTSVVHATSARPTQYSRPKPSPPLFPSVDVDHVPTAVIHFSSLRLELQLFCMIDSLTLCFSFVLLRSLFQSHIDVPRSVAFFLLQAFLTFSAFLVHSSFRAAPLYNLAGDRLSLSSLITRPLLPFQTYGYTSNPLTSLYNHSLVLYHPPM